MVILGRYKYLERDMLNVGWVLIKGEFYYIVKEKWNIYFEKEMKLCSLGD